MTVTSLNDITADFQSLRNKATELSTFIDIRHKLTANIEFNLYGGGDKEEGRQALAIRNTLDETLFGASAADMVGGDKGGLDHMKQAITLENLSEKMQILEGVARKAKATSMKAALIDLLTDADRYTRFIPEHQKLIKAGAAGLPFLANWRINKVIDAIQRDAREAQ